MVSLSTQVSGERRPHVRTERGAEWRRAARLLRIGARREPTNIVFILVGLIIVWVMSNGVLDREVMFWANGSLWMRVIAIPLAMWAAANAAYAMARDELAGVDEITGVTARPPLYRALDRVAVVTAAALGIWLVIALISAGVVANRATWGGPQWDVIAPAPVLIIASALVGGAVGLWVRTLAMFQMAVALIVVVAFMALPAALFRDWVALVSPMGLVDASPWFGVRPVGAGWGQALVWLGIGLVALALITRRTVSHPAAWRVAVAGLLVVTGGLGQIRAVSPPAGAFDDQDRWYGAEWRGETTYLEVFSDQTPLPYEPSCAGEHVSVCVHPAFGGPLPDLGEWLDEISASLAGQPGAPERLIQMLAPLSFAGIIPTSYGVPLKDGELGFTIDHQGNNTDPYRMYFALAEMLFSPLPDESDAPGAMGFEHPEAHEVMMILSIWSLTQAGAVEMTVECDTGGLSTRSPMGGMSSSISCDAYEQFAAVDDQTRDEWLRANYERVRAGELGLDDLPGGSSESRNEG